MGVGVPHKALFLVSIISNTEINIYFQVYKLNGGLPYNTDCFSYWQGTMQASYAVMRQLLFKKACHFSGMGGGEGQLLKASFA